MTFRCLALVAGLTFVVAAAFAPAQTKEEPKDESKGVVYKTPNACFDAFIMAFAKKDVKVWVGTLSPEAQNNVAGELAAVLVRGRALAKADTSQEAKEQRERFRPLVALLDKHGLTEKATKGIVWDADADEKNKAKVRKAALALVKQPETFLVEAWSALDKVGLPGSDTYNAIKDDVKVVGDKATATGTMINQGRQLDETLSFVKVGDGWRLNPPPELPLWRPRGS